VAAPSSSLFGLERQDPGPLKGTGQKHIFAYFTDAGTDVEVSLTMPLRLESWLSRDLHPIFQMNLPEGALLEVIRRAISKVVGTMTCRSSE